MYVLVLNVLNRHVHSGFFSIQVSYGKQLGVQTVTSVSRDPLCVVQFAVLPSFEMEWYVLVLYNSTEHVFINNFAPDDFFGTTI